MSVRGVRVWRRIDVTLPPSFLIEHTRNEGCLMIENGACLEIKRSQFEDWKLGYTKITDAYGLMGILRTKEESYLIAIKGVLSSGQLFNSDIYKITMSEFIPLKTLGVAEHIDPRIVELQKLISSGMFYFSALTEYDLTLCAQKRAQGAQSDERFFWNRSLHFPLQRFGIDSKQWFLKCISGSCIIRTVYIGAKTGKVAILSRLSCERVGTRFNVRGANDMGNVANFVETEQLILFEGQESSFIQIRGSIPLFWDQPGIQVGSHKVKLRAFEASAPAYKRHFLALQKLYENIIVVNLLGHKEGERVLGDAFQTQHKNTHLKETIPFIHFDYHAQMKISRDNINYLKKDLQTFLNDNGFFQQINAKVLRNQTGVVRTNCLDCLDRTNNVQTLLGLMMLRDQITSMRIESANANLHQRFEEVLKDAWVKNGDQCSIIYAGTGALEGKSKGRFLLKKKA
ncbi:unnamed protein product, partial [Mesorhabditis belari]|uniref:Phosphatidylinositol-3-phosphatase SAC1 n=1 Tax=Mesorhabditis belari TaxID=2138241 RepID=A0AAF3J986_9BILA